jgi:hypothetical protein
MRDKSQHIVWEFMPQRILRTLGALESVREQKRMKDFAIVGQDCIPEKLKRNAVSRKPQAD